MNRTVQLTWLKFLYLKANQELDSIEAELDILGQAAQMDDLHTSCTKRASKDKEEDSSWRVERFGKEEGPLVSATGKVICPFTDINSLNIHFSAFYISIIYYHYYYLLHISPTYFVDMSFISLHHQFVPTI
ncbi:hypothetical protein H4Q26_012359 [Puccinia striiformis f. sp. tritici PST-130]|nr:hypothetical protein H4Q26_012359 [Puccinia striiformis f. sp. tritici PST-130]